MLENLLVIILVVLAIIMIAVILLQPDRSQGLAKNANIVDEGDNGKEPKMKVKYSEIHPVLVAMQGTGIKKRSFEGIDDAFGTIKEFSGVIEFDDISREFKVSVETSYKYCFGGYSKVSSHETKYFDEIEEVINFLNTIVEVVR